MNGSLLPGSFIHWTLWETLIHVSTSLSYTWEVCRSEAFCLEDLHLNCSMSWLWGESSHLEPAHAFALANTLQVKDHFCECLISLQCYYIFRDNLLFCFCTACTPGGCDGKEEVQIALSVHCSRIVWFAKNMPKSSQSNEVVTKISKFLSPPALPLSASTGRGSPQVPRLSDPPAHCEGSENITCTL